MARMIAERSDVIPVLAEVFRTHGYEGATLSVITEATGLGKGSLYHFFPDGKAQMAAAVLAEIDHWFEVNIFAALRKSDDPALAITEMTTGVDRYFRSGHRVCLVGVMALGASRDIFAAQVQDYFSRWNDALALTLRRAGFSTTVARRRSADALLTIQGALVLARARNDAGIFRRALSDLTARLLAPSD